ncbi:MAG TPA: hypothetical protein VN428_23940 [Bryobacteraceae bacterium]|nr:hypothetical protein [Bryobacteraceae bacterium]
MASLQQRLLIATLATTLAAAADPPEKIRKQEFHEFRDFIAKTFGRLGGRHAKDRVISAQNVDGHGEVPDSAWYENRHARRRMSVDELRRGPGDSSPPAHGPWKVVAAKREGVTPGFQIEDAHGRRYLLKFDPPEYPELVSGAEIISTKFFYALGYHVPENYIVRFDRARLAAGTSTDSTDKPVREQDIDAALALMPKDSRGQYRALASLMLAGEPLGPFFFSGTRKDDPEDTIPHEHRRELRGLYIFSAWLNHTDAKAGNTLDMLVEHGGRRYIKHYLIDFGATLGSASFEAKSPRQGYEHMLDLKPSLIQLVTLGAHVPKWARAKQAGIKAVGSFEAEAFDPDRWKPNYPNPAFENRLPEDSYWAARRVMAFTDEEIRAIVETAQYTDPRATEWITRTLIVRRDKIARTFGESGLARVKGKLQ